MKNRNIFTIFVLIFLTSCVGTGSKGVFGTGVSIALDPRSLGTQIDDSIMQKNLLAKLVFMNKKYALTINSKVLDGRIFLTGKVENPEEKLRITKIAWEIKGVRSVKNDINLKENFNFKRSAEDLYITSRLKTILILSKDIKAANYNIDTYKRKVFIYGIAQNKNELNLVIDEAKNITNVLEVIASILLVEDLRIQKN